MKYANGCSYDGEWRLNLFHGFGTLTYPNGDYFKGEFVESKRHGKGAYYKKSDKTVQEGYWKNDKCDGSGVFKWPNGIHWEGEWKVDKGHGAVRYRDRNAATPTRFGVGKLQVDPDLLWLKADLQLFLL